MTRSPLSLLARLLISSAVPLAVVACGPSTTTPDTGPGDTGTTDTVITDATADAAPDATPEAGPADSGSDAGAMMGTDVYDPYNDPAQHTGNTAITAPDNTWTWVPFGDAVCANGQSTGIGVNLHPGSTHVMIFMQGGGACWDGTTCYGLRTAANVVSGYGAGEFTAETPSLQAAPFFSRTDARNPFRDMSFVYVPYCTGDVHAGSMIRTLSYENHQHPTFFEGYRNMEVFLRRLVPTFASADRVWLTGSSAGGFGAAINWERTQTAFGSTRVDLIDDSGPPLHATTRWTTWRNAWNIQMPSTCANCVNDPNALIDYYTAHEATGHRFALLSYTRDNTISGFFAITQDMFESELTGIEAQLDATQTLKYYVVTGTTHTLLPTMFNEDNGRGTPLTTWLQQMVSDDPAWASTHP